MEQRTTQSGITAVLALLNRQTEVESAILDLAAVLDGLVADRFEIIVVQAEDVGRTGDALDGLHARCPGLPLRILEQPFADRATALAAGFDAAAYDLIFAATADGQFDVRELNHLLEAIERGADVALGYRVKRDDGLMHRLQGWGWNVLVNLMFGRIGRDVDCAFKLFRRSVWKTVAVQPHGTSATFCAELLIRARRLGFRVAEVPVSHHRPVYCGLSGVASATQMRQALAELNELRRDLEVEKAQPARDPAANVAVSAGPRAA